MTRFSMFFVRTAKLKATSDLQRKETTQNSLERVQCILPKFGSRRQVTNQQPDRTPSEGILQDSRKLRVAIGDPRLVKVRFGAVIGRGETHTAPWFNECTTCPKTLRDLLIAADSAIREGSLPVSYENNISLFQMRRKLHQPCYSPTLPNPQD